jgi:hypothetical protein
MCRRRLVGLLPSRLLLMAVVCVLKNSLFCLLTAIDFDFRY